VKSSFLILLFLMGGLIASEKNLDVGEHNVEYLEKMKSLKPELNKSLPQIFFAGDSISVGYGPAFKVALEGKVNALHWMDMKTVFKDFPKFNYGGPVSSLKRASTLALSYKGYSPNPKFLMLNSGLHDVHRGRRNFDGTIKSYLNSVKYILDEAENNNVQVIWLTTTYIGSGRTLMGKDDATNPTIKRFNREVVKLMKNHFVIDLCKYSNELIKKYGEDKIMIEFRRRNPKQRDMVHFTDFAQIEQGKFLAKEAMKIMKVK
jgi:hypothetical protein